MIYGFPAHAYYSALCLPIMADFIDIDIRH